MSAPFVCNLKDADGEVEFPVEASIVPVAAAGFIAVTFTDAGTIVVSVC